MEEYVTKETHYWSCRAEGISWRSTLLKRHITGAVERGEFMEEYVTKETHYWSCRAGGISWRSTLLKRHITGAVERRGIHGRVRY